MIACPACGTENPKVARFCMRCGGPLTAEPEAPARELRKVVTVVFADVTGSTGLGERLDPESLRAVMGRWFDAMRRVLERHGGSVEKFIGDAVVAVFGVPVLHEDDALRAVRAADEMRASLAALNAVLRAERGLEMEMRIGLNTGEVVVGEARAGGSRATGDAVNVAARLQQAAEPGEVLVGESTWRLVRDAVDVGEPRTIEVRGRTEPVEARALRGVRRVAEAIPRRIGGSIVGRDRELATLASAFERAVDEETCVLVTVLGAPGVGKSRLVHEFLATVRDRAHVMRGRCLSYGEGITWLPVAELLRSAIGAGDDADPAAVRAALEEALAGAADADAILARLDGPLGLAPAPVPRDELFWAARRFVERLGAERPVIVVLDDLQWAEGTLLDLVEHLADWVTGIPVMLLLMTRPELLDARAGWGGGKPDATTFRLEPLPRAQTELLVATLLEGAALPAEARAEIAEAADGNPLYVEQVIEVLLDDGALRRTADGTLEVGDQRAITVPPTIQALLAARLDRLDEPERRTIERAAVVGKEFRRVEVAELTPAPGRDGVPVQLRSLVRKELIRLDRQRDGEDEAFRFRHLLIRDAAYESLPKGERAELHERFADWLEATAAGRLAEADEIVGYHLDQARTYRLALGPDDDVTRGLALRAGHLLAAAGLRALDRGEPTTSLRLLDRAASLLEADPGARFAALVDLTEACWSIQEYATFIRATRDMAVVAPAIGEAAVLRARMWDWQARSFTDPSFTMSDVSAAVEDAAARFEAIDDIDGLLEADTLRVTLALNGGRWRETIAASRIGWDHAHAGGRDRHAEQFGSLISNAYCWGLDPVDEGLLAIAHLLAATTRRTPRIWHLASKAVLHAYAGDADAAGRTWGEMLALGAEMGISPRVGDFRRATIDRALDDPEASLATARRSEATFAATGETGQRSTVVAVAGQACLVLGDDDEAMRYADESRRLAAGDDAVSQILWRAVAGVVHARRGEHATADRLTLESIAIAGPTDAIAAADAWLARAETLALAGRAGESADAARTARALYAAKGFVNAVRWAERWAAEAAGGR